MTPSDQYRWYSKLRKPFFAPPSWLFGPAWTFLYILIAISFGAVFVHVARGEWPVIVALPFVLNLIANVLFTTLQFRLRRNDLAFIDVLAVLVTIPWAMWAVRGLAPWIAWMQVPYLCWVSFASVLQGCVTWLNRGR